MSSSEPSLNPSTENLLNIDDIDAFKLAFEMSDLTLQQIAAEMGWSNGQARRIFSTDKYFPSFPEIPRFCAVVGNMVVVNWLMVRTMAYGAEPHPEDVDCSALVGRVGELFGETGDVGQAVQKAIQDGKLTAQEIRRIISEVRDVVSRSTALLGDLRAQERRLAKQEEVNRG